jgi:hypothetical protein
MNRTYNIYYITHMPIGVVLDYVRRSLPPGVHPELTLYELRLLMLKIMYNNGQLDQQSRDILDTPLFGKAFVAEKGDVGRALVRILVDSLPGASLFRLL